MSDATIPWSRLRQVVARIPEMSGQDFTAAALPGGRQGRGYRVTATGGRVAVILLNPPPSGLVAIDRSAEHAGSLAAAAIGVGPRVLAYLPDLDAMALQWIEGRSLNAADLREAPTAALVAATCRTLHGAAPFDRDLDIFDMQRRYQDLAGRHGRPLPEGYAGLQGPVAAVRVALAAHPEAAVPCHNDLVPSNMLTDGERVWFVDFEYAANATPSFELGNICASADLVPEQAEHLVAAYWGAPSAAKIARTRLMALMCDYTWPLWAGLQQTAEDHNPGLDSGLDSRLDSVALTRYERAREGLLGPGLAGLLTAVGNP